MVKPVKYNLLAVVLLFISRYRIIRDPAGWLNVDKDTGLIKVKSLMDRESTFVKDNRYTALIGAYDDGRWKSRLIYFSPLLHGQKRIQIRTSLVGSYFLSSNYCLLLS